jgi:hypothetical protein
MLLMGWLEGYLRGRSPIRSGGIKFVGYAFA